MQSFSRVDIPLGSSRRQTTVLIFLDMTGELPFPKGTGHSTKKAATGTFGALAAVARRALAGSFQSLLPTFSPPRCAPQQLAP